MLVLAFCLIVLEWVHASHYGGMGTSPVIRIKSIFLIITGTAIMKFTTTGRGFRIFLIIYLGIWLIYYVLNFMAMHGSNGAQFGEILMFYKNFTQLSTPLPFIFFWLVDRLFLAEEKKI